MSGSFLRPVTEADAPALLAIYAPYVRNTAITFEYDVPTEAEFARRIRTTLTRFPYLAAVRDGEILGYAYTGPFAARPAYQWAAETSIYIRQDAHRLGLGKRLYEAIEAISKAQGLTNLYAKITCPTGPDPYVTRDSVEFHAALGYALVGSFHNCGCKFGRWYDMVCMEKMLSSHVPNPGKPIPFPELDLKSILK